MLKTLVGLTGRRGYVDGVVDVCWLSWPTLVAGGNSEQILLPFHHVCDGELQVLDTCGRLRAEHIERVCDCCSSQELTGGHELTHSNTDVTLVP